MTLHLYEPPAAAIDWEGFHACVLATRWSRLVDLERDGFTHGVAWRMWNGKPVGLIPFLRTCKLMKIAPLSFLMER